MLNIKSPQRARNINKKTIYCDVQSRADSAAAPKTEVVPGVDVRDCGVFGSAEGVVYEAVWIEFVGLGVVLWIVMESPHVDHYDCVFGDEVAFIPVILDDKVILAKFIHWTPSKGFLQVSQRPGDRMVK